MTEDRDADEQLLFASEMVGVQPIQVDPKVALQNKAELTDESIALRRQLATTESKTDDPLPDAPLHPIEPATLLSFQRAGLQLRQFDRLRKGHLQPEDCLDLHGFHLRQARQATYEFIKHSWQRHFRCVRIIHGKSPSRGHGFPLLKSAINHWLPEIEQVLAFHSAPANDGGSGAVYVLLKTHR